MLSGTASSGLQVTFEVLSGPGAVAGNLLTLTGSGTVQLRALQGGDEDWLPADAVLFAVIVNPAPPPPPPPPDPVALVVCPQSAHQYGPAAALLILQVKICDASGRNISSRRLHVAATGLVDQAGRPLPVRGVVPGHLGKRFVFEPHLSKLLLHDERPRSCGRSLRLADCHGR